MMHINLLPYREQRRKDRRNRFYLLLALVIAAGVAVIIMINSVISGYVQRQQNINNYIQSQINNLNQQTQQVNTKRQERESLLERRRVIENLQNIRGQAVRLLNEIALKVPEGVYLTSIQQTGKRIQLQGYAQANSRVSALMRNLEESPYLQQTRLIEVKAATQNNRRISQFSISVDLADTVQESGQAGGA